MSRTTISIPFTLSLYNKESKGHKEINYDCSRNDNK